MSVKEHYDNHLANFYSWMAGDFKKAKNAFKDFCLGNEIKPFNTVLAIDLGAGHGIQSIALAEIGFKVKAIDFNKKLLGELKSNAGELDIQTIYDDITNVKKIGSLQTAELIICCGDTISHLQSYEKLESLIKDCYALLPDKGKIVLSFRDYSIELKDTQRFIPVKSDHSRIHTCIIEYFEEKIRVTDLLHEMVNDEWMQRISSYEKLRIRTSYVSALIKSTGFKLISKTDINRMVHIVCLK